MDLETLKNETLELIDQYNQDKTHRKLEPINGYGDPSGGLMLYWVYWSDDQLSTYALGFTCEDNQLRPFGSKSSIPLENAIDNFKDQLGKIPSK